MHLSWIDDYKILSEWINKNINGNSVGDIGCGNGYIIDFLSKKGKAVWGVDGSKECINYLPKDLKAKVKILDLTQNHKLPKCDISICLEVAEHIESNFSNIFIKNIISTKADTIIFTAGPTGQPGINHINCQEKEYWISKFIDYDYSYDFCKSNEFSIYLENNIKNITWFAPNIMIFRKMNNRKMTNLFPKKKDRLIMTLLVRDEKDVIKHNIEFHLRNGVDFIIATDNGSVDGTKEILLKYQDRGQLYLIEQPDKDYSQAEWVNKMGDIAFNYFKSDYIFHCDADEFWYAKKGNLKTEVRKKKNIDVFEVSIRNVLLSFNNYKEKFPKDCKYSVIHPTETNDLEKDSLNKNIYLFRYPPKVIYRTAKIYIPVVQGNHGVAATEDVVIDSSNNIFIYHFPVRSWEHFSTKVINGGSSYENNKKLPKSVGFHWRRWYESYRNNTLKSDYKQLVVDKNKAKELIAKNVIEKIDIEKEIKYFGDR
jgi:SAM-dependent methyltransferase